MAIGSTLPPSLFDPTEEHAMLRQTLREFVRKEVEPQAEEHDKLGKLNIPLLRKIGELGLIGVTIPEEMGGAGMDAAASVIVHEELSYADPGFALAYLAHALLFVNNFYYASNAEQHETLSRARPLPPNGLAQWA